MKARVSHLGIDLTGQKSIITFDNVRIQVVCLSSRLFIQVLLKSAYFLGNHRSFQREADPIGCSTNMSNSCP